MCWAVILVRADPWQEFYGASTPGFLHHKSALKHRVDALHDQPDAVAHHLVRLQLNDVEMLA